MSENLNFLIDVSQASSPMPARASRTTREAFGHYEVEPLRKSITFNGLRRSLLWDVVIVATIGLVIFWGLV